MTGTCPKRPAEKTESVPTGRQEKDNSQRISMASILPATVCPGSPPFLRPENSGARAFESFALNSSSDKQIEIDETDQARKGQGEEHRRKVRQAKDDTHDHRSESEP